MFHLPSALAIGAITIDPNNHNTIYAATGENDNCGGCGYGVGIYKSTDAAATWTLMGAATFATVLVFGWVLLISGVVALVEAFQTGTCRGFFPYLLTAAFRISSSVFFQTPPLMIIRIAFWKFRHLSAGERDVNTGT